MRLLHLRILFLLTLLLLAGLPFAASAQSIYGKAPDEGFGKNRIQYKDFEWKYYQTTNFNVYYYQGGADLARYAAEYAETDLKRISALLGYYPYSRTTLLIYNSVADLQQSNIGLNQRQFQGDGLFLASKIELAFPGTHSEFKKQLSYHISELLLNDMMYGGSLKEVLQSNYLLRLPDWFVAGAATYLAEGWSARMDNYMRDLLSHEGKRRPEKLLAKRPELAGQAIWNFVAERYGTNSIQNILNLTRITRDIEIGVANSVNLPYREFLRNWAAYYAGHLNGIDDQYQLPDTDKRITPRNTDNVVLSQAHFSPDGSKLAYVTNELGRYKVKVYHTATGKTHTLFRGGLKSTELPADYDMPLLAWKNNEALSMVMTQRGKLQLRTLSASGKKLGTTPLEGVQQVRSFSYSSDGRTLALSLVKGGQTDIYLMGQGARGLTQLTNDLYDDLQPSFVGASATRLVFSSNRIYDSLGTDKGSFARIADNYDIFLYDPALKGPSKLRPLTSDITNEFQPRSADGQQLLYLSESSGIRSVHRMSLEGGPSERVTGFLLSMNSFDYSAAGSKLAFITSLHNREGIYYYPGFTLEPQQAQKTFRQEALENRLAQAAAAEEVQPDPRKTVVPTDSAGTTNQVDINNYAFDNEPKRAQKRKNLTSKPGLNQPLVLVGPYDAQLRFSIKNFVSSFYIDPYFGLGFLMEVGMTDMFENHRMYGGLFFLTDFHTSNFYGEYQNLQKRYDWKVAFDKKSLFFSTERQYLRFNKNEFMPQLSYPLTYTTSFRVSPRFMNIRFTDLSPNSLQSGDIVTNFVGGSAEVVYDNSTTTGLNMHEGTRAKVGVQHNLGIGKSYENFGKLYLDARHYLKIHRQLVWANRVSYGHYFGPAAKNFLIGGMENWIGRNFDREIPPLTGIPAYPADFFYLDFVTPMRGFNYNTRFGSKYVLLNSELRFPIVQYLVRGPVYSGFFRNLQLTGFTDVGTAYNGLNPFNENNTYNTQVVGGNGNAFTATVTNYRNPFLIGYGFGMRTMMLGMYTKLDVAWGRRDYIERGPKFYVTLGYDF